MKRTHISCSFAEETQRDIGFASVLGSKGDPGSDGNMAANDSVTTHKPFVGIKEMHGTAAPFGTTSGFAKQLSHCCIHITDPSQVMRVLAIGGENVIGWFNRRDRANRYRFFSIVEMKKAANLATGVLSCAFL